MKEIDRATSAKFDKVLSSVRDRQSELTLAELGFVKKISYFEKDRTIVVYLATSKTGPGCPACAAIDGFVQNSVERDLTEALQKEFPGFAVQIG